MTLSVPSFLASATSASIPPPAAASVAVAHALPAAWPPPAPAPPLPPPPPLLTQPAVVRASRAPTAAATTRRVDVLVMWSPCAACDGVQRDRPRRTGRVGRPSPQSSAGVGQWPRPGRRGGRRPRRP